MENGHENVSPGVFPHVIDGEVHWLNYPDVNREVKNMSDSEKLDEILYQLRSVGAAIAQFQNMGPGAIMKMIMGGK